jgi:chemotaxis protein methyltransferase CheR
MSTPNMTDRDFRRLSEFIQAECGIHLPPKKRVMLISRLLKRLRSLGMTSFGEYFDYVTSPQGRVEELAHMIDVVTTNKTEFFREAEHFDFLYRQALPTLVADSKSGSRKKLWVWSAGCSSGEEPYTIAMILAEFVCQNGDCDFSVLGTDISTRMLEIARRAIYPEGAIEAVPIPLKHKYLMWGKGSQRGSFRVVPELRSRVQFRRVNLIGRDLGVDEPVHIIFCRNVIIYFDRATQIELFRKFYNRLVPGGYLFIGHSETLRGINDRFTPVAATIYRKPG